MVVGRHRRRARDRQRRFRAADHRARDPRAQVADDRATSFRPDASPRLAGPRQGSYADADVHSHPAMSSPVNTRQERLESPAAGAAHGAEPAGSRGGSVGSSGELMHARALRTERVERPRPVPNRPGAREVVDCTLRDGPMCSATRAAPQLMRPLRSPSIPPRIRTSASGSPARRATLAAAPMSAPPPGSVPPPPVSTPPLGTLRTCWTKVSEPGPPVVLVATRSQGNAP